MSKCNANFINQVAVTAGSRHVADRDRGGIQI